MRAARAVDRGHRVALLLDAIDTSGGHKLDVVVRLHALEQRLVHVGAVAHGVGIAEALAEGLAHRHRGDFGLVDRVHHHQPVGVDRARAGALAHAERVERGERIGAELDAGADLADVRGLLEDLHREAAARERQRGRETADAAAGNEDRGH